MKKSYNCLGKGLNKEYFYIKRNNNDKHKPLSFFIENINFDDYFIYKYTNKFREVSAEDSKEFKYAGYIFFKKSLYNKEDFDKWIKVLLHISKADFKYLIKPFPSIEYLEKIKVCYEKEL
tara:strand:+ start:1694 stop:2053 length:360 start_codon:yes stop_codon:yes gene_type:complete